MAGQLKVTINKKHHNLKFGYGVFKRLSNYYQLQGFNGLGKYVDGLGFGKEEGELTFAQLDFLGNLIIAAVEYAEALAKVEKPTKLDLDQVVDQVVLDNPDSLPGILEAFTSSFPQGKEKGNLKPATKKK